MPSQADFDMTHRFTQRLSWRALHKLADPIGVLLNDNPRCVEPIALS